MIREMKLHSSSLSPVKKMSTSRKNTKITIASPKSPNSRYDDKKYDSESTFYNSPKHKKLQKVNKEDAILENLKNFVKTSTCLNELKKQDLENTPNVVFTSKEYLNNNNIILSSLVKKKINARSSSSSKLFCSFNKEEHCQSSGKISIII
jgi:hypothetical protein